MTKGQEAIAAAAIALVGVRYRPQGRDPRFGLDCLGVVAAALDAAGHRIEVPDTYAQRGSDRTSAEAAIDGRPGLERVCIATAGPGDILLMEPNATQRHFGIVTAAGVIHADARLRRVVETPGAPPWAVVGAWRVVGRS
jgi:cell wall-associated NlpC family hydrolase